VGLIDVDNGRTVAMYEVLIAVKADKYSFTPRAHDRSLPRRSNLQCTPQKLISRAGRSTTFLNRFACKDLYIVCIKCYSPHVKISGYSLGETTWRVQRGPVF